MELELDAPSPAQCALSCIRTYPIKVYIYYAQWYVNAYIPACMYMYLGDEEDEETGHTGCDDHEHRQAIGGINEVVYGEDEAQGASNAHHDHHDVHGNADEA